MATTRRLILAAACAAGIGCSGENIFTDPVSGGGDPPRVVLVNVPESVTANDALRVEVTAESEEGIASIDAVLEQGMVRDTTVNVDPPETNPERILVFQVPGTVIPGSTIHLTVTATDRSGDRSQPVERDIAVVEDDGFGG